MSLREKLFELNDIWFEKMLDKAISEETHVTVIFHTASQEATDYIEAHNGFWFDYEGVDAQTGNRIGTRIMPNEDGDYIVENVEIGTHIVHPELTNNDTGESYATNEGKSTFYIDKNNHEFYSLILDEPQVTTQ